MGERRSSPATGAADKLADYFGVPVEELVAGGKGDDDAPRTDPPSLRPTVWDGVPPEEA